MDTVDLTHKTCPEGHTDLKVVSQKNDCYIIRCNECGWVGYEHDLVKKKRSTTMDNENSETTMWVVRCPKNHHVAWNGTKYWCERCSAEYGRDEIVMTPVEKREKSSVRPTVYGHPN